MRHLATYLLLVAGGNASPSAADVTNALATVGLEVDEERLNQLISELEGKDVEELIEQGKKQLVQLGGGGGGGAAPAAAAAPAAGGAGAPAKKEEKPKEEEVDALEGGMDMFGGGGGGGDY